MAVIRSILVKVGADVKDLQKKMEIAQKSLEKASGQMKKAGEAMTKNLTAPILAIGAALGGMTLKIAKAADDMADLASVFNLSVGDFQTMAFAGEILGTSMDTITAAQRRLTRSVYDAQKGNKEAIQAFQQLGVAIYDSEGNLRDANDIFWDTIEALGRVESQIIRDGLAMELMGRSAQDLNPIIKAGREEFERLEQRARDLGLVLSEDQVKALADLNDEWGVVKQLFSSVGNVIAIELEPVLRRLMNVIIETMPMVRDKIKEVIDKFKELPVPVQNTIIGAIGFATALGPLLLAVSAVTKALAFIKPALAALTGPVGLVIAAVAALAAIFIHLWNTNEEFRAAMTEIWEGIKTNLGGIWESIKGLAMTLWGELKEFWEIFGNDILNIFKFAFTEIGKVFKLALGLIGGVLDIFIGMFTGNWQQAWNGVGKIFGSVWEYIEETVIRVTTIVLRITNNLWHGIKGIINNIIGGLNTVISAFNSLKIDIPAWVPGIGGGSLGFSIPQIPMLATGAILTGPTLFMGGEGGENEAVLPLSKLDAMLKNSGGGNVIQVILDGRVIQEYIDNGFGGRLAGGGVY